MVDNDAGNDHVVLRYKWLTAVQGTFHMWWLNAIRETLGDIINYESYFEIITFNGYVFTTSIAVGLKTRGLRSELDHETFYIDNCEHFEETSRRMRDACSRIARANPQLLVAGL